MMSEIRLQWTARFTPDEYRVYRSTSPINVDSLPPVLATLSDDSTSFLDVTVTGGVEYYYVLAAIILPDQIAFSRQISIIAREFIGSGGEPVGPVLDSFAADVKCLFDFNDSPTVDVAENLTLTATQVGTFVRETVAPIEGGGSFRCNGSGYVSVSGGGNAWQFVDGANNNVDFTVEFFMQARADLGTPGVGDGLLSSGGSAGNSRWIFFLTSNTSLQIFAAGNILHLNSGASVNYNDGAIHHVAWVREGSTCSLYVDGNRLATTTSTHKYSLGGVTPLLIATDIASPSTRTWNNGLIDGVRITHAARYSGATYDIPSLPYPPLA